MRTSSRGPTKCNPATLRLTPASGGGTKGWSGPQISLATKVSVPATASVPMSMLSGSLRRRDNSRNVRQPSPAETVTPMRAATR